MKCGTASQKGCFLFFISPGSVLGPCFWLLTEPWVPLCAAQAEPAVPPERVQTGTCGRMYPLTMGDLIQSRALWDSWAQSLCVPPPFFFNYRKQLSFIGNIITKLVEVMEFQLSYFKS